MKNFFKCEFVFLVIKFGILGFEFLFLYVDFDFLIMELGFLGMLWEFV